MSNKHTQIQLTINVRKLDAKEFDPKAGLVCYKAIVASVPVFIGNGESALAANEDQALHRTLLRKYIHDDFIAVKLSKGIVLAKKGVEGKIARTRHTLVLTTYEGPRPIPTSLNDLNYNSAFTFEKPRGVVEEHGNNPTSPKRFFMEWAKFKRSSPPAGRRYLACQRWFRIHGTQSNEDQVQYDTTNAIFRDERIQFYIITMDVVCFEMDGSNFLTLSRGITPNGRTSSLSQQLFTDLGGRLKVEKAGNFIQARRALGEPEKVRDFPGLQVATEPASRIYLDENNVPSVALKSQTSVYLQSEFTTLSDFVAEHYHADLCFLQSFEGVKMLTVNLRGVGVKLGSSNERHMVMGFRMGPISDLPFDQLHHASSSAYRSSTMPLVNLGTLEKPRFLPMEQCQIEARQPLRGPRGAGLSHYVNFLAYAGAVMRLPESCETAEASLVYHQLPKNTDMNDRLKKACNGKAPNLLFVEVGLAPVHSKSWFELRNGLQNHLQQCSNPADPLSTRPGIPMPLLSLRYDPKSGLSTQWTRQLRDFVEQCAKPEQKTIVIVWLESEQDHNMIYNIIKTACDVHVGAQTFFVRRGTFESQIHNAFKTPSEVDPITRYAADVRRRICQKNSHMLEEQVSSVENRSVEIVIAMHVSPVYVAPKRVSLTGDQHGKPNIYLVTLVSRDPTQSKDYCTEQGLFSRSQITSHEHVNLVSAFTSKLSTMIGDMTIMRSGVLHFVQKETDTSDKTIDLTNSANFRKLDDKQANAGSNPPDQKTQVQFPDPTSEMEAIEKHFPARRQPHEGPRLLRYIVLTEDDNLSTRMDPKAYKGRPNDNCSAMLLMIAPDSRSINVQQIQRVRLPSNSKKAVRVRPGAITARFRRAYQEGVVKLAADSHSPSHVDTKALTLTSNGDSPGKPMSQQQNTEYRKTSGMTPEILDPMLVAKTDIDMLAALWTDDGLGLYSTKWPIPTHLARLAAKRAMIRLRTDDWQNEHTAPFSLPSVHENVRDTLYYL